MLDKIMEAVGGNAMNEMTSKAGISMDQAKQMLPFAQESLQEGLMSQVTSNPSGLLSMFQGATSGGGGLMQNAIFGSIKGMFMKKIMTNMGLPESVAGLAAGSGMGSMIGGISSMLQKDGDNDDINVGNIMSVLGGGGAAGMLGGLMGNKGGALGGLADAASSMMGGAKDGAGDATEDIKDAAIDKLKDITGGLFGK